MSEEQQVGELAEVKSEVPFKAKDGLPNGFGFEVVIAASGQLLVGNTINRNAGLSVVLNKQTVLDLFAAKLDEFLA